MVIAAGRQAVRKHQQRLLLDVEHAITVDPGIRRERDVDEQRDGKIVRLAVASPDGRDRAPATAGAEIAARAHQRVEVEIVPVGLGAHQFMARPQHLETAAHLADVATHGLVRRPALAPLGGAPASTRQ